MKIYDLKPVYGQKSFYGKAVVCEYSANLIVLKSYNTEVCRIDHGDLVRMWDGYSSTTQKHVIAFCDLFGIESGGKSWWLSLPVDNKNIVTDIIKAIA